MSPAEADLLVDRRRLKRQISFWRLAALALVGLAILGAGVQAGRSFWAPAHIGRLTISGVIADDPARLAALVEAAKDSDMRALILRIDSPGGTVVASEELHRQVRAIAARLPVVAVLGQTAASGGYMVALAADRIVAREGTITGSIGVMMQSADVTGLLRMLGVSMEQIKSSPLKAVPNPFEPLTDAGRDAVRALIDDTQAMFLGMLADRRRLDPEAARRVGDGRVFTGRQALGLGLIDALGGEDIARDWLAAERGIPKTLRVHDIEIDRPDPSWRALAARLAAGVTGKAYLPERLTIDGLVALWHPDLAVR